MAPRKTEDKWDPIESLGATGAAVARNVKQLRLARGLAYTELSEELGRMGRDIPTWGLRKIESGGRRVDADDLVALSAAFDVSPATLLMPNVSDVQKDDLVDITGWRKPVPAGHVWRWLTAIQPLVKDGTSMFLGHALPPWERARRIEAINAAINNELGSNIEARNTFRELYGDNQ